MVVHSDQRGHAIYFDELIREWRYTDDSTIVKENYKKRPCGKCSRHPTQEGHDACLGTLPGVSNACCGHSVDADAYIQFDDDTSVHGIDAVTKQQELKDV